MSIFEGLCADVNVCASARASIDTYWAFHPRSCRAPVTVPVLLMIALHFLDTGGNYKQMGSMWELPRISLLVKEGLKAITGLNNIHMPTTQAEWLTSAIGFEAMHGLPNIAASLDITPVFCLFKSRRHYCPELKRHCVKVATLTDSSGRFLAHEVFPGAMLEPEILNSWEAYHRIKATEALIGLPGVRFVPLPPLFRREARAARPLLLRFESTHHYFGHYCGWTIRPSNVFAVCSPK